MMSRTAQAQGKKKPLVCPICHMTFLDKIALIEHKKKDHSFDPEPPADSLLSRRAEAVAKTF